MHPVSGLLFKKGNKEWNLNNFLFVRRSRRFVIGFIHLLEKCSLMFHLARTFKSTENNPTRETTTLADENFYSFISFRKLHSKLVLIGYLIYEKFQFSITYCSDYSKQVIKFYFLRSRGIGKVVLKTSFNRFRERLGKPMVFQISKSQKMFMHLNLRKPKF